MSARRAQATFETARLRLRPSTPADAVAVQALAGDPAIADTTCNIPHPYSLGMAEAWIGTHALSYAEGNGVTFMIALRELETLVGCISLMAIAEGHQAELGYWIGRPYWGRGYGTEAGAEVLRYGFEDLKLQRIHAVHFKRNPASGRILQKVGMTHEGRRPGHIQKGDKLEDIELYGILRSDWELKRSSAVNRETRGLDP